jgi:hypothetical protein
VPAIAVLALVAVPVAPVIGAFLAVVSLNHLLGGAENVPFSRYSMFSRPSRRSWALRYEDESGAPVNIGTFGIIPPSARKRFDGDVRTAREAGRSLDEARESAARSLAEWLEERRTLSGASEGGRISIALIEYEFDGTTIVATRLPLAVDSPG